MGCRSRRETMRGTVKMICRLYHLTYGHALTWGKISRFQLLHSRQQIFLPSLNWMKRRHSRVLPLFKGHAASMAASILTKAQLYTMSQKNMVFRPLLWTEHGVVAVVEINKETKHSVHCACSANCHCCFVKASLCQSSKGQNRHQRSFSPRSINGSTPLCS